MSRKGELRVVDYLGHMLDTIGWIELCVADIPNVAFLDDTRILDAVIRSFEILGKVANNIDKNAPEFVAAHPDIPWSDIYRLRNQVAHGYFQVDLELV